MCENPSDFASINPYTWTNIPIPLVQAFDLVLKSCCKHNQILSGLTKESITKDILTSLKSVQEKGNQELLEKSNSLIYSQLQSIDEKFSVDLTILRRKTKEAVDELAKEISELKAKVNVLQKSQGAEGSALRELIFSNKEAVKTELNVKFLRPEIEAIRAEWAEMNKTVSILDKQLRYQSYKLDNATDDIHSKLTINRDDIKLLEVSIKGFTSQIDQMVDSKTEDLFNKVSSFQIMLHDSFDKFQLLKAAYFDNMTSMERQLQKLCSEKTEEFHKISGNCIELSESIGKYHNDLSEKMKSLQEKFEFESEKTRIESEKFAIKCYEDSKERLKQCYREDMKIIKQKLEWLPHELDKLKDLSPIEARLFTLESRLRREENNRIIQKIEIMKEIGDKSGSSIQNRSITPTNQVESKVKIKFHNQKLRSIDRIKNKTPESLVSIVPSMYTRNY